MQFCKIRIGLIGGCYAILQKLGGLEACEVGGCCAILQKLGGLEACEVGGCYAILQN
jgi:hypothetical protein